MCRPNRETLPRRDLSGRSYEWPGSTILSNVHVLCLTVRQVSLVFYQKLFRGALGLFKREEQGIWERWIFDIHILPTTTGAGEVSAV